MPIRRPVSELAKPGPDRPVHLATERFWFRGHAYRLNTAPAPPRCSDRLLLIGDAAGLAMPQSGEGIRPAIESGLIAADVLADAGPQYDRGDLRHYTEKLGLHPRAAGRLSEVSDALRRTVGNWLLNWPWFVRHIVLDRWFLNRNLTVYSPVPAPVVKPTAFTQAP